MLALKIRSEDRGSTEERPSLSQGQVEDGIGEEALRVAVG